MPRSPIAPPLLGITLLVAACGLGESDQDLLEEAETGGPDDDGNLATIAIADQSFAPVADATVEEAAPTKNLGGSTTLASDASPRRETVIKFEVSDLVGAVTGARLRLHVTDGSSNGPAIYAAASDWTELGVSWDDRPARIGVALDDVSQVSDDTVLEYDLSAVVTGPGTYSVLLTSGSTNGTQFASREGSGPPELILAVETGTPPDEPASGDPILVGAGDISSCKSSGDSATAKLLDGIFAGGATGVVYTLGDNVYEDGTAGQFSSCYDPTWGRHKARTRPSPGNHDYHTAGADGYFDYFGAAAGKRDEGYYSYDLGAWHIIVINSNCTAAGGCGAGSPQETWLRDDLAAHPTACTLAYWHHPRFSSSHHGNTTSMQPIWQALYDADADVVLGGHDHSYERFAPQTPTGAADPARGLRQFVVGTGGKNFYALGATRPNSVVRMTGTFGVLKLTLHASSYDWAFVPEAGKSFSDSGTAQCH